MWKNIKEFYRKNYHNILLQILPPGLLTIVVFIAKKQEGPLYWIMGIIAILLIPTHVYLIGEASKSKFKESEFWKREVNFWKRELKSHKWLLNTIQEMVTRKLQKFKTNGYLIGENEYRDAIIKNLSMLLKFYQHYSEDPGNSFRITYLRKSDDGKYLKSIFYSTEDGEKPYSHGDDERQKEIFDKYSSQSLAVKAWKELRPVIAENETEINYLYPQQKDKIKSIIALPVFSGPISEDNLIGIITIASNKKEFFKRADLDRHKDYIEEFVLRIVFEYCKLQSQSENNIE